MPNPQLGGQFAPKATFGCGDEAQTVALQAQSSTRAGDVGAECTFKPLINRNVPDFGRMHAQLARQLAAIKEARKFQQITKAPIPFSFAERKTPATKPQQLTPADIAAIAHDGGVKQVTTSNWESFTQVTWEDGSKYAGEVKNGVPHGHGAWTSSIGSSYRGGWSNGVFHGQGTYVWRSGDCYTGAYLNGIAEGKGKLTLGNGDIYEGNFVGGLPHGTGAWMYYNTNTYQGEFANGQAHGHGIFIAPGNGDARSCYRYEGQYSRDEPHGQGTIRCGAPFTLQPREIMTPIRWSDGSKFVGAFQRGAQTGSGELTTIKGDVIKGSWLNGRANGSIILTMAGGDVFEGQFENGVAHGKGSYVFACGDMWEGEWKEGRPWKVGTLTCPLSANPQSQPAIWSAVGTCPLSADAFVQPLSPNFIFQQTPAAATSATLRGINFPLKTPGLPLSGDSSMMAAEKQRSAFSYRPERRDVAALLISGASQASLVDSVALGFRNPSPRLHRHRKHNPDCDSDFSAQFPLRPTSSNGSTLLTKVNFKGRSEEKFRQLAADSSMQIRSKSNAAISVSFSSEKFQDALDAADAAQAQLNKSDAIRTNQKAASACMRTSSASNTATGKTSKKNQQRNIVEAWV